MDYESYLRVFQNCDIHDQKIQSKLLKLAKDLKISELQMLIFLETLPDVSFSKHKLPFFLKIFII